MLARNSVWNFLGFGLPLLVALGVIPFLTRELGPARFGILALAGVVVALVSEMGLWRAVAKYGAEAIAAGDPRRLRAVVRSTLWIQVAVWSGLGVALWLAADRVTPWVVHSAEHAVEGAGVARVLALILPLVTAGTVFRAVLEAAQRFGLVNVVRIPVNAGTFLLPLLGIALGWDLVGVLWLLLASRVVALAFYARLAGQVVREVAEAAGAGDTRGTRAADVVDVLRFGGWTVASATISVLLVYLDRFFLGAIQSAAAVGYYTPPFELATRLLILPAAAVATLLPAFSALSMDSASAADRTRRVCQSTKLVGLAIAPGLAVLAAFAPEILTVWVGAEFAAVGSPALRILTAGVFLNGLAFIVVSLLQGGGRPELVARAHLAELIVYVPLLWWLVSAFGVAGAALAWSIRAVADALIMTVLAVRAGHLPARDLVGGRVVHTVAALAGTGMLVVATAAMPLALGWRAAAASVILGAGWTWTWRFALSERERSGIVGSLSLISGGIKVGERG